MHAVYDVTQKQTFDSVSDIWMQEVVRRTMAASQTSFETATTSRLQAVLSSTALSSSH